MHGQRGGGQDVVVRADSVQPHNRYPSAGFIRKETHSETATQFYIRLDGNHDGVGVTKLRYYRATRRDADVATWSIVLKKSEFSAVEVGACSTGHDAFVVKFIMPAPRIRNVSYPQAKQCASVEVPKAMFPAVKPNRMIEWSRHQIWLLVGQFRARSNHSHFSLSTGRLANEPTHHPVRQPPQ